MFYQHRCYCGASILGGMPHSGYFLDLNIYYSCLDSCELQPPPERTATQSAVESCRMSIVLSVPSDLEHKATL